MELKTLDFGKSKYVTVAERLRYFRTSEEFKIGVLKVTG